MALKKSIIEVDILGVGTAEDQLLRCRHHIQRVLFARWGLLTSNGSERLADGETFCVYLAKDESAIGTCLDERHISGRRITRIKGMPTSTGTAKQLRRRLRPRPSMSGSPAWA